MFKFLSRIFRKKQPETPRLKRVGLPPTGEAYVAKYGKLPSKSQVKRLETQGKIIYLDPNKSVKQQVPISSSTSSDTSTEDFVTGLLVGAAIESIIDNSSSNSTSMDSGSSSSSDYSSGGGGDFSGGGSSGDW